MRRRRVVYEPDAVADLEWIYDVVEAASGAETVHRYEQRIRTFCNNMDLASERGILCDDLRPGLRVTGFERRVTIAFAVGNDA